MKLNTFHNNAAKWHLLMIFPALLLVVAYLWQMNNQAAYSFSVRKLENEKSQLAADINELLWQVSDGRTLANIQDRARELSLVPPQSVDFIEVGASVVAVAGGGSRGAAAQ